MSPLTVLESQKCSGRSRLAPPAFSMYKRLVDDNLMCLAVVDKVDDIGRGRGRFGALVADDVERTAVAVANGELLPLGGYAGIEGELAALFAEAEDVFDASFVGPRGGAGVPCPAATTGMLRIAVDVRCNAEGLHFVFEDIGKRLRAVDGVDEGVEEVGHVIASFFELSHDVPHGTMCVLATVFAYTHGVVHDVAW